MAFRSRQTFGVPPIKWFRFDTLQGVERWLEQEREQVPLWLPIGFGIGISAWLVLPNALAWMGWCLVCAAFGAACLMMPAGTRVRAIGLSAALLGMAGCLILWSKAELLGTPPLARARFVEARAIVRSVEPRVAEGMVRAVLTPIDRPDLPRRVRINVAQEDAPAGLMAGATIAFRARLMPPAPPAVPGAYDFAQRAYFQGIGATGKAVPPIRVEQAPASSATPLRQRLSAHVRAQIEGGAGAIAAALATGDVGAITEEDAEAMRRSGLAHLLSISGLHVTALIGATIFIMFRLLALSRRLALRWPLMLIAAAGGAVAGIGYTLLTGAEVPTVRSIVAALLVLGGLALGREAITLRLVASGALFVLLLWPESLAGPSFQMSFAAVTAIVALAEHKAFRGLTEARDEAVWRRLGRGLLGLFLSGVVVELVLAPIALFHFHRAGMLGSIANLVAIPLTTFVVMPFEAVALALDTVGVGAPAWWIVDKALGLLLWIAHAVAASPMAVASLPAFSPIAFALAMTGILWCLLWRTGARWLGLAPLLTGIAMMLLAPHPDILVTGDGRHVAVRLADGRMTLLRDRAGDYVRDTLSESAGYEGELAALAALPEAQCNPDQCAVRLTGRGRSWHLLATRSADYIAFRDLERDCAAADIVVSDRRLPRNCRPRWLKIDRAMLRRTGGVAIYLGSGKVRTVMSATDRHPWITQ